MHIYTCTRTHFVSLKHSSYVSEFASSVLLQVRGHWAAAESRARAMTLAPGAPGTLYWARPPVQVCPLGPVPADEARLLLKLVHLPQGQILLPLGWRKVAMFETY